MQRIPNTFLDLESQLAEHFDQKNSDDDAQIYTLNNEKDLTPTSSPQNSPKTGDNFYLDNNKSGSYSSYLSIQQAAVLQNQKETENHTQNQQTTTINRRMGDALTEYAKMVKSFFLS